MFSPEGQWTEYKMGSNIYDIAVDNNDQPWFGTEHAVLTLNDDGTVKKYDSLPAYEIAVDREGRVWIGRDNYGSIGSGVNLLHPDGHWETYTIDNSELVDDWITTIEVDPLNRVWIGARGGISVISPDGNWTTYTSSNSGLYEDHIDSLVFDDQGQAWIMTFLGIVQFLDNKGNWTTIPDENTSLIGAALVVDRQGRLWASGYSGLKMLSPGGQWVTYNAPSSEWKENYVRTLESDAQGRIYAMRYRGITVFDEQQALTSPVRTAVVFMRGLMYIIMIGCIFGAAVVGIFSGTRSEKASAEVEMPQPILNTSRWNKISLISFIATISAYLAYFLLLLIIFIELSGDISLGPLGNVLEFVYIFLALSPPVAAISGIITGYIALPQIKKTGEKGKGFAISGILLGIIALLIYFSGFILG
jgi:hypothetical protein